MYFLEYEFPFTANNIKQAPERYGIVTYYDDEGRTLTIASATGSRTIRDILLDSYKGYEGNDLIAAAFYGFEICSDPISREQELLIEHEKLYGRMPLLQVN